LLVTLQIQTAPGNCPSQNFEIDNENLISETVQDVTKQNLSQACLAKLAIDNDGVTFVDEQRALILL
jgi:hypothetical protein